MESLVIKLRYVVIKQINVKCLEIMLTKFTAAQYKHNNYDIYSSCPNFAQDRQVRDLLSLRRNTNNDVYRLSTNENIVQ